MPENQARSCSHLFTLRVWVEEVGNGRIEFRGEVKHVLSGETHFFSDWQILIGYLEDAFAPNHAHGAPRVPPD